MVNSDLVDLNLEFPNNEATILNTRLFAFFLHTPLRLPITYGMNQPKESINTSVIKWLPPQNIRVNIMFRRVEGGNVTAGGMGGGGIYGYEGRGFRFRT